VRPADAGARRPVEVVRVVSGQHQRPRAQVEGVGLVKGGLQLVLKSVSHLVVRVFRRGGRGLRARGWGGA
jgi:hypothetical protein